ncbi:ABC transporter permease [Streptomyces sp. DSM 44915]|uniref:Transport permease protein n=1 Tax=Streptomyces chisholmiae TaxID=3075540 RepID=A0ABU2JWI2_9ACTN|nr:ABC transporter permease [Streptomyces sp. DSM 44915]MDT0269212.1 ABC transporter permease [Streptomyces sp. DSM 44915]
MSAYKSLSLAMIKGLLRDRTASFFTLIFPLMFLLLFGALFQNDSVSRSHVLQIGEVAVLDAIATDERHELSEVLDIEQVDDREEALSRVSDGGADAVVWEDADGRVELRYSAADATRAGTVHGLMQSLVQTANLAATGQPAAFELTADQVEDKSIKAIQFLAPGLLGWAIAMGASFMSAFTLVNWRKKRILRRLWLAPISPATVIGARIGVSLGMALLQTALFVGIATIPFYGLQLTGSWYLVIPLVAAGTLAFMSVGLLIGAWAKSDEAANAALQLVVMPMAFLSGSFFPLEGVPGWVAAISNAMPLKHLNESVQGVLTRGESWGTALPAMVGLLLFAAVVTAIAARLFRWDDA